MSFYILKLGIVFRYLFNCGENTVRILHELNRLKMNISQVFLTGITWQNHIAGLPTLIKCHGSSRESALSIYGPEGITKFLKDVSTFSSTGLQRYQALKLFTSTEFICNSAQYQQDPYIDDNITILPVIFERKDQDVSFSERQSICYICEFANLPGQFLLDKAVKLGVTEESFNELAIGNPVLSSYGRKVRVSSSSNLKNLHCRHLAQSRVETRQTQRVCHAKYWWKLRAVTVVAILVPWD